MLEKLEQQVNQYLATARQLQEQLQTFRKQSLTFTQQNEIKAREMLHQAFDNGLTLLGKGIIIGRKATESFVAETHRKANKLEKLISKETEQVDESVASSASVEMKPVDSIKQNQPKQKNPKFKGMKNKKHRSHTTNTSKSH
jgi:hypothetical protein